VAAGAVARQLLAPLGVRVRAGTVAVADVTEARRDWDEVERNPVRCPDAAAAAAMEQAIRAAQAERDSVGGVVEVVAAGVPPGWGDPTMDGLDAAVARALMSIPAVKGVEIGDGFALARARGSAANDTLGPGGFATNRQGGVLGGIATGQDVVARIAVKPASSIGRPQATVDTAGRPVTITVAGRHDPCICPRVVPVAEAMLCLVLVDAWLAQRALRGA
jgi:chorismate synthase